MPAYDEVAVGAELPVQRLQVRRSDLIRYAGASGDFNVIHWNERVATDVGLPNVIAHGMFTMAFAARALTDWLDDPRDLLEYAVRFSAPVVVPDDDKGATLVIKATVAEKLDGNQVRVTLTAETDGRHCLARAYAVVRLR